MFCVQAPADHDWTVCLRRQTPVHPLLDALLVRSLRSSLAVSVRLLVLRLLRFFIIQFYAYGDITPQASCSVFHVCFIFDVCCGLRKVSCSKSIFSSNNCISSCFFGRTESPFHVTTIRREVGFILSVNQTSNRLS